MVWKGVDLSKEMGMLFPKSSNGVRHRKRPRAGKGIWPDGISTKKPEGGSFSGPADCFRNDGSEFPDFGNNIPPVHV